MIDGDFVPENLIKVVKANLYDTLSLQPEEYIALEHALEYNATYVYFRKFKNRPSIAQVYIYDYTEVSAVKDVDLITLHQRLYSAGQVPMFFVFTKKDVRIFNCFDRPAKGKELIYKPLTTISLAAKVANLFDEKDEKDTEKFKAFSGKSFDNGSFWESSPYSKDFQFSNGAYEKLLTELKQALTSIIDEKILESNVARKIMVISILVKYLEERTDEKNNSVFPGINEERICIIDGKKQKKIFDKSFFDQFATGAICFTDVLKKKGAALKLFDYLALHFNGGVFQLSKDEKESLKKSDLTRFALFLEGKLEGIQFVFWRLYSFNDLPVELISNIYEEFLEKKPGVVYTPPYLVNFLLDETMPLSSSDTDFKVLDPACGSGVFLVGSYRRLIYRWRKENKWKRPGLPVLKKLLKENIFGSDKDPDAVNLTIFSLSLALCDELTPLQIWEDLEFDNLKDENLFSADFFSLLANGTLKKGTFNLVIGNPPFEAKLTDAATAVDKAQSKDRLFIEYKERKEIKTAIKLPDNQISLLFLEQSIQLCKPGKLVCLIQPSGPLLYNNTSLLFRRNLMQKYNVPQIIDFTHLSRVLFGKNGDVATAAIFVKNEKPNQKPLLHVTVRRTKTNKEKIYFELDTYDFNHIPRNIALNDTLIWKSNFIGGNRVHQLVSRLSKMPKLVEYIKEKDWIYEEGFMVGGNKAYKKAAYLTGKKTLPAEAFTEKGIDDSEIHVLKTKLFYYLPNPLIFKGPHILIKEIISNDALPTAYRADDLTFQSRIVGIHGPLKDARELKHLQKVISQSNVYPFYIAATSAQYLVNKSSAILKQDIDNLPFSVNEEIDLDEYEKIIINDFFKYQLDFRRGGEKALVSTIDASDSDLRSFGTIFCDVLNKVYKTLKAHKPFVTDSYICFPFYFKNKPNIEFGDTAKAESEIEKLVYKTNGISLRMTRVVRLYEGNTIYIIKPKKIKYWLESIALQDADETFSDLRKQGF